MRHLAFGLIAAVSCAARPSHVTEPKIAPAVVSAPRVVAPADPFAAIDVAIQRALDDGKMPGCVVVVGRRDEILLRRAYGSKAVLPERTPMTADTLFDLASLTKPMATATSIMILRERGLVELDARASKYIPELSKLPPFTIRELLLHTSGLPAVVPRDDVAHGPEEAMRRIGARKPIAQPSERFLYSDVGYIVLGEIVRRVSGRDLGVFASAEIFDPLGMKETGFSPKAPLKLRAAPTEIRDGAFMIGDVHDPLAWLLGGVAGNAGVFSTADDVALYARAMLQRDRRLMNEDSFGVFTSRQETPKGGRTLGWDMDSAFATNRSADLSSHAFGHGGFTGTALWIDPDKDLFCVFLSNRVHPEGQGAVNPLIAEIESLAVHAMDVKPGIDVLRSEHFARLAGLRIGLITNAGARAKDGTSTIDVFRNEAEVKLAALLSPEHGIDVDREGKVEDSRRGEIPVYSLYGERFAPPANLPIDAIVFDLQDVGVRFYTYASTMRRAMKVASEKNLRFIVLDRPNPIDGIDVQGPLFESTPTFVNHGALPIRHGMTMGELARLFANEDKTGARLEIVAMQGWRRKDYFDRTGLSWTSPSPNLRSVAEVVLYPALGLVEGTNVSVGRGTDAPFELLGAPWMDGDAFAKSLSANGAVFEPATFTPSAAIYRGEKCNGVKVRVVDRDRFDPIRTGIAIAVALRTMYPSQWQLEKMDALLGNRPTLDAIRAARGVDAITQLWDSDLAAFREKRRAFLIYP